MLNSLSILLPSYNNNCVSLVKQLHRQAELLCPQGLRYEIIVADDGSTNFTTIASNQQIEQLSHCRFIRRNHNSGRAAIRNFLAQQASQEYLLFIDSDRMPGSKLFLYNYLSLKEVSVACGGLHIVGDKKEIKGNIRFLLERKYELHNTARERSEKPYHNFNTSNFMVRRDILLAHPFDKRFLKYGYEDVLWGKVLKAYDIPIQHIDNPILLNDFETNSEYLSKTEEGIDTLFTFQDDLRGFNGLLALTDRLNALHLSKPISWVFQFFHKSIKRNLLGVHPSIPLFHFYKLGLLLCRQSAKE